MSKETTSRSPRTAPPELQALGREFLQNYFRRAGLKITVSSTSDEERSGVCTFRLDGEVGVLKRVPRQVDAIERLTSMAMSAQSKHYYRCQLDLEGQLSARRALVGVIAADAAAVAKHTHKRAIIEGLNSFERRSIHQLMGEDGEVETLSDGEGEFRYLMVAIKT